MTMLAKKAENRAETGTAARGLRDADGARNGHDADDAAALRPAAALFHGLADPTRLLILRHLYTGEHRVKDLTEHLGLAQSTVSAHLSCLRDCGLVLSRPQGRASMFSLAAQDGLAALLDAAEALLAGSAPAATGAHAWHERHAATDGH